jgi:NADPH-dependent 2,4-dienoyl-CoA reductase/sulfur reductase-like enzyme
MELACKYLIVGGGMTADAAVRGIRELDPAGKITVVSAESHPPYDRPPLSKKLWTGKPLDSIWRMTEDRGVDLRLGTRAVSGDAATHTLTDSRGDVHTYEKLLLATGGAPRRLPFADAGVIYFRTLDDYQRVRALCDRKAEFVVIGGGFIGSEITAALAINGCTVSMVFPDTGIGARIYPPGLSAFLNDYYREKGITLLPGETVSAIEKTGAKSTVMTGSGKALTADAVIAGIGIEPETGLAKSLRLKVDNGIVVDEFLRTSHPDIYAAGDVANFYSPALGVRRRVEHEDNANTMGAMAGRNMAGRSDKYEHLPYFYSDLFDLGYEAVGEFGGNMEIVEDWKEPFHKGVVYYLKDGHARGVLLWNTWDRVDAARELIGARETLNRQALMGRISD